MKRNFVSKKLIVESSRGLVGGWVYVIKLTRTVSSNFSPENTRQNNLPVSERLLLLISQKNKEVSV